MKKNLLLQLLVFCIQLAPAQNKAGLIEQKKGSQAGYVLFAPLHSKTTYLIDKCGRQVHTWQSSYPPGQSVYLLENGDLLRTANDSNKTFKGGGRIEKFDWNNKLVWSYRMSSATECQHHDVCPLPNGNILVLSWEKKTTEQAIAAGRDPKLLGPCIWSEKITELRPSGKSEAAIVWEWHVWDHLVQDRDSTKNNYGKVSENPQLMDLNFLASTDPDWLHFNSIAYNSASDQVLISNRNFSEIFILDRSTTTLQAASHRGGNRGKGGDLLYRYGNPRAYGSGDIKDQVLFAQHNAHWIEPGLKDAGKIMLFNNGLGRRNENYSSVDLIDPAMDTNGNYLEPGSSSYLKFYSEAESQEPGGSFFSPNVSSAQRLGNGNTLVCSGSTGRFCELDENRQIVWLYMNPVMLSGIAAAEEGLRLNQVFRCTLYEPTYKGFKGKKLIPGAPIEKGKGNYSCVQPR
jgi:hypothetical protein